MIKSFTFVIMLLASAVFAEEMSDEQKQVYFKVGQAQKKVSDAENATRGARLRIKTAEGRRDTELKNAQKFAYDLAHRYYLTWTIYISIWERDPWAAYEEIKREVQRRLDRQSGVKHVEWEKMDAAMANYKKEYERWGEEVRMMQDSLTKAEQDLTSAQREKEEADREAAAKLPKKPIADKPAEGGNGDHDAKPEKAGDGAKHVFTLKDGTVIRARMAMKMGDLWKIKDVNGDMLDISAKDVEKYIRE